MADSHDVCTQVVMADSYNVCMYTGGMADSYNVCMYTGGDG